MKELSEQEANIERKKQFQDLVDGCKYLCQCNICRFHRAADFRAMRKTNKDLEQGLVNWDGKMS